MPDPVDPRFDHAAAEAAAEACEATAAKVRSASAERTSRAMTARCEWSGGHRAAFDAASRRLDADSSQLGARLIATATLIRSRARQARADQAASEAAGG